ncbi:MAG: NUDIX domain-containing protein [Patescibacteria group bacterium]|nr:NUDIX domain-containing protein [Patescibacteria group bacterium]
MAKIEDVLREFSEKLPKFSDGRIDYSSSDKAPVLTCFVKYQDKILLLKRSDKVRVYKGLWNTVAGYIDELCPVENKALAELEEELGITEDIIGQVRRGTSYEFHDKDARKTWIIFPLLADLKEKPAIKLDWEHTEFKWIKPDQINEYNIVPNLNVTLKKVL